MPQPPVSPIYLDYAATTPVDARVREAMLPYLGEDTFGNPSSLHRRGKQAARAIHSARKTMGVCLGIPPETLVFTSGATEADNWIVLGTARAYERQHGKPGHIITSTIEHAAIQQPCLYLAERGWDITWLGVDAEGFVSPDAVVQALRPDTALVSLIHGNNEIGTIQDVQAIGHRLRERNVPFHIDAVQTVGKLPGFELGQWPVDYASMSAHKLYGPKGVGALYIREGAPVPESLIFGGGQEGDWRSGTENVAGIVGFARALEIATELAATEAPRLRDLQQRFVESVEAAMPTAILNGPRDVAQRVPGNVHFSFPPHQGEALVLKLDLKGIQASSGSACHSEALEPSRIILALGKSDAIARATVRFSFGRTTHADELTTLLPAVISFDA